MLLIFQFALLIIYLSHSLPTEPYLGFNHVRELLRSEDGVRGTSLACSRCSSASMDEEFHCWREVKVDHIIQIRNIKPSRCKISHNENLDLPFSKLLQCNLPRYLVKSTIDHRISIPTWSENCTEIFNMISRCSEDDRRFLSMHHFSKEEE
jgi:hypothetical protein